jgi:SAM-dependent methyltransferase
MPGNNPIQRFMARQLHMPSGWFGAAVVSEIMNRVNKSIINSTIELLQIEPHQQVLEIGFGGGAALSQIAARLQTGAICGVDISRTWFTRRRGNSEKKLPTAACAFFPAAFRSFRFPTAHSTGFSPSTPSTSGQIPFRV